MRYDIAAIRKRLKMSQQQLAEHLGIRQSFLSAIETGKSPLPDDKKLKLQKLCNSFDMEEFRIAIAAESTERNVNNVSLEGLTETNMLKELLNYFHTQAHRDQDEHHKQMHLQIESFQERNDRLQQKIEILQDKNDSLNNTLESLRNELHETRSENLRLKELLLKKKNRLKY